MSRIAVTKVRGRNLNARFVSFPSCALSANAWIYSASQFNSHSKTFLRSGYERGRRAAEKAWIEF